MVLDFLLVERTHKHRHQIYHLCLRPILNNLCGHSLFSFAYTPIIFQTVC